MSADPLRRHLHHGMRYARMVALYAMLVATAPCRSPPRARLCMPPVIAVGTTDLWGVDTVKVFCPCCRELYEPTDVDAHYIRTSR